MTAVALGLAALLAAPAAVGSAQEPVRPELVSYFGRAPKVDGVLAPGEWADATQFRGARDWVPSFSPVTDDADLTLRGFVKHDATWLYFGFEVGDDVLYGIDTPRWLPPENPKAHDLSPVGFPWFGDEIELLIDARHAWSGDEIVSGDGSSWQMVVNLTKSRKRGVGLGKGGLLEGEPRNKPEVFATYRRWIDSGAQKAVARKRPGGKGYVIEWAVKWNPCVELAPGKFYAPAQGEVTIGINIALGDLDRPEAGAGNFGGFHHEQWLAGTPHTRAQKNNFGTLKLMGNARKP